MLAEHCPECGGMVHFKAFSAIAVDEENLVMHDQNKFQSNTALDAWKRPWAALRKWFAGILIDARFADLAFIRCLQEAPYCCRMQDAINERMEVEHRHLQSQC